VRSEEELRSSRLAPRSCVGAARSSGERSRLPLLLMLCFLLASCAGPGAPGGPTPTLGEPVAALRVTLAQEGIYGVDAATLAALGIRSSTPSDADLAQLQLYHGGVEQPLYRQAPGVAPQLLFYGQPSASPYARESSYILRRGDRPGLRMRLDEALLGAGGRAQPVLTQTWATARAEENLLYSPLVDEGDRWLWASLPAPQQHALSLTLHPEAAGAGEIRVSFWGTTEAPETPDHHAHILLNGQIVADERWDGKGRHEIVAPIAAGNIRGGANDLLVELPGDTGVAVDIVALDWVELRYPLPLRLEGAQLLVEGGEGLATIENASGALRIFDITGPQASALAPAANGGGFWATAGRRYLVLDDSTPLLLPSTTLAAQLEPALRGPGQGADYLAIGPPDLLEPLQPLLQLRAEQGLKVQAIPLQAIFDQYGDGTPEPEAIKALLREAQASWQPAPRYVLLLGDASSDPRGYLVPPEANRLPTFLVQTAFGGETASDTSFAMLDGDTLPDLAVGRVPARSAEQVRSFVAKTISYEREPSAGDWRRHVLAVADGQEPNFGADASQFTARFGAGFQTELLAPPAGAQDVGQQVRERIDQGQLLVAYFGHGSISQWGKDRLFSIAESAQLANAGKLPIVVNMTCLAGLFSHPKVESLAEALLWHPDGGAVAVLAPTSLTLPTDQSFLSQSLATGIADGTEPVLGDLVLAAWRAAPLDNPGAADVLRTFLLFGDPALRLVSAR
jgi:hypothetical protein